MMRRPAVPRVGAVDVPIENDCDPENGPAGVGAAPAVA